MTHQLPPELFVSGRPVRSDFARERSYARRRVATVAVLAIVVGGGIYALQGRSHPNPADIPTIRAEGTYKEKPADPGGIDIPHQNILVYDELEGKNAPPLPVEHLLPPPETPENVTPALPPAPAAVASPLVAPTPGQTQPAGNDIGATGRTAKLVQSAGARSPFPTPVPVASVPHAKISPPARKLTLQAAPLSIEQVIANTKGLPLDSTSSVSGKAAVQLASLSDEAKARSMMLRLQKKYSSALGGTVLRLVRADLGVKGVYYRIQSQALSESGANRICSSLKQANAGCILVKQ